MSDTGRLALAISIPVWSGLAIMIAFSAYYSGFTGMGIVFIISIVAIFYWYKALEMFYGRNGREHEETGIRNTDDRLTSIERKISEISEKMK